MTVDLSALTSLLSGPMPSLVQLNKLFTELGPLGPATVGAFVKLLNVATQQKLFEWADAWLKNLNAVNYGPSVSATLPPLTADYDEARAALILPPGVPITQAMLDEACNSMAKALKAENWIDGFVTGIQVAAMFAAGGAS